MFQCTHLYNVSRTDYIKSDFALVKLTFTISHFKKLIGIAGITLLCLLLRPSLYQPLTAYITL